MIVITGWAGCHNRACRDLYFTGWVRYNKSCGAAMIPMQEEDKMKVAFCDDNVQVLAQLEDYAEQNGMKPEEYESFHSGEELLGYMEKSKEKYDIYFLDISMPGKNGIDTASEIREKDRDCLIIFLTDYKEYVYQVFEVLPFRFLRKPLGEEVFSQVMEQAREHQRVFGGWFFFRIGRREYQVACSDILCFEAQGRKVCLRMEGEEYTFYGRIGETCEKVEPSLFVQTHASYVVNMEKIRSVDDREVMLKGGVRIPVSRKYRADLKKRYLDFVKWRCGK